MKTTQKNTTQSDDLVFGNEFVSKKGNAGKFEMRAGERFVPLVVNVDLWGFKNMH